MPRTCSIPGCEHPHASRGWCQMHYCRWKRHGDPFTTLNQRLKCDPLSESFWDHVDSSGGPSTCWPWKPRHTLYGRVRIPGTGRNLSTHRVAWELTHGTPIPAGLWVLHHCDNPSCCNPDHLYVGTHADNVADKVRRGRGWKPIGELHPSAKLTAQQVREIRARINTETRKSLAEEFGVSGALISHIVARRLWKHLP